MNNSIRFSVVTITYNAIHTLERTLKSVAEQTWPNIEYIIIDGASTDGTLELIQQYASHITSYISEPDRGLYDAMNKGLHRCTGHYVCFLNAGDTFCSPTTLADIATHLPSELPDVVYGDTILVDDAGHYQGRRQHRPPHRLTWKSFQYGMLVCHQAFLVRPAMAPDYDLQYRYSADFDWCIRILRQTNRTYNTHQTLIRYLNEGVTTRHHKASLRERFRIMSIHYGTVRTLLLHVWFVVRAFYYKFAAR